MGGGGGERQPCGAARCMGGQWRATPHTLGPMVTATASASLLMPAKRGRRASGPKVISLA